MAHAQSLFGQRLREESDLREAVAALPEATFSEYGCLTKQPCSYLAPLVFCFIEHKVPSKNNVLNETLTFVVWQYFGQKEIERRIVFEKEIVIDQQHFINLINYLDEKAKRHERHLALAQRLILLHNG